MSTVLGLLNNTIEFSAVDGPGNRFVIFLQGCNFNCVTCHNPYTITRCNSCSVCVGMCPEGALTTRDGPHVVVDWAVCTSCDICIDVCPADSTPLAKWVSVNDLLARIRVVAPFISGVTISGGEATMQADFIAELFIAIKGDDQLSYLTTFVDSNGSASIDVWDRIVNVMDGAMIDLKALDPETHIRLTARENGQVLDTIRYLADNDRLHEVRLLIVPGYNDDLDTMRDTATWLRTVDPSMRIKLIGYRSHGVRPEALHIKQATSELLDKLALVLTNHGFDDVTVM